MKKIILVALLLTYLTSNAQEFIIYKNKLLPDHKYTSETNTSTDLEMHVSSGKEDAAKLEAILPPGFKLPLKIRVDNQARFTIITNPVNKDREVPFSIYYSTSIISALMNNQTHEDNTPLYDQKIYGRSKENGKVKLDSVTGKKSDKLLEEIVSDVIKNLQSELQPAEQSVKIGDTFTQKMPLTISIPQINLPSFMDVKITYKLVDIKGDEAFFDLTETTTFNYYTKQIDANMDGQGNGKMVYDIKNGFIISTDSNLNCTFTIKSKDGKRILNGAAKLTTKHSSSME